MAKKGRHRRYEEAREFQRSSTFSVEEFDLDAPDPFALPETGVRPDDDVDDEDDADDEYAALAAKYADFDDTPKPVIDTANAESGDSDDR